MLKFFHSNLITVECGMCFLALFIRANTKCYIDKKEISTYRFFLLLHNSLLIMKEVEKIKDYFLPLIQKRIKFTRAILMRSCNTKCETCKEVYALMLHLCSNASSKSRSFIAEVIMYGSHGYFSPMRKLVDFIFLKNKYSKDNL